MDGKRGFVLNDFTRFAALSGCGWLVDTSILLALVAGVGVPSQLANLLSASTAAALVYLVAHRSIYAGSRRGVEWRLGAYLAYTGVVLILASAAIGPLSLWAGRAIGGDPAGAAATFVAKCLVTPPQLLCNFLVSGLLARGPERRHRG